jgi:hypothetical protein
MFVAVEKFDATVVFRLNRPEVHNASNLALETELLGTLRKAERESINRGTLSIANPLIRKELGWSLGDMGFLLSAFLRAYAFSQRAAGGLV